MAAVIAATKFVSSSLDAGFSFFPLSPLAFIMDTSGVSILFVDFSPNNFANSLKRRNRTRKVKKTTLIPTKEMVPTLIEATLLDQIYRGILPCFFSGLA